jgi:NADH-quinone oxidoreductase subunit C
MTDDTPSSPPEETANGTDAASSSGDDTTSKPQLTDEEKAAKIAAAKKKAAAMKAAEAAEPKDPWDEKPVPPQHEDAADDEDAVALAGALPGTVLSADRFAGEITLTVSADQIVPICTYLKADRGYKFLVDLTAVDWPDREGGRFDVVYWLHRHDDSKRLRLLTQLESDTVATVCEVWKTANWMEREAFDMFGIIFEGHPSLERILTWEGFNGHPLRKDFPVEGIDTGAAIYPDVYPPGGGPPPDEPEAEEGGAS